MVVVPELNADVTASSVTHSAATSIQPMMPSVPNCNGRAESSEVKDAPPSTYQMLLKQVENLRKENSTLRTELKNNTSHISKLENEMKDMVSMLGTPGLAGGGIEPDICAGSYLHGLNLASEDGSFPCSNDISGQSLFSSNHLPVLQSPMKLQNGLEQEGKRNRPEFLLGLPQNFQPDHLLQRNYNSSLGSVSPSPTMAVADVIKKKLLSLNAERSSILRSLNLEEQKKKYYLKQLTELTSRLDNVSDSDKFAKPSDETRKQIEMEIANLKKTMDQSLGSSSDIMQERLQARLDHIHLIENEIMSFEQHLRRLEMTTLSPCSPSQLHSQIGSDADTGTCTQHGSYHHGGLNCTETSSQTPRMTGVFGGMIYEEEFSSYDHSGLDLHIVAGGGKTSRAVQTVASCLAGQSLRSQNFHGTPEGVGGVVPYHDPLASRSDPKAPGSIDSLPSQSDIDETASMHSFTTSLPRHFQSSSFGPKKDGIHSPSFLQANKEELSRQFLKLSKAVEGCWSMKQTNYIPFIVQIIHDGSLLTLPSCWTTPSSPGYICTTATNALKTAKDNRIGMAQVLRNIVHVTSDVKFNLEILSVLEFLHGYCEQLFEFWIYVQTLEDNETDRSQNVKNVPTLAGSRNGGLENGTNCNIGDVEGMGANSKKYDFRTGLIAVYDPPIPGIKAVMKLSHNEVLRGVINEFGGLYTVAELFILHCRCIGATDLVHTTFGKDLPLPDERTLVQLQLLRRLIGFALINLTYGDMTNKAILIQMPGLIDTVMAQMAVDSEEMQQVFARFVRNLSWQPDENCRDILRGKNVVAVLMKCALKSKREDTLKSVLSALWNLSGHCPENRASICSVKGALAFLVSTLMYRTTAIIECGGGILRNVSSVVATSEEYRQILRDQKCLHILLTHLKAASLTIVSNACGTLWNLSARNAQDQKLLWDLGAVPMLKNLVHSKHSVIAQGSSAALRNLLANRPGSVPSGADQESNECIKLKARKQKSGDFFETRHTPTEQNFSPRHHAQLGSHEKMISPRSAMSPQRHSLQETSSSSPVPDFEKARRFQKGGLHYSGSVGSLPSTEFSDSIGKSHTGSKYIAAARNCNSYPNATASNFTGRNTMLPTVGHESGQRRTTSNGPGFARVGDGMLKDVMIFNDMPQPMGQTLEQRPNATTVPNKNSPQSNMSLRQCFELIAKTAGVSGGPAAQDTTQVTDSRSLKGAHAPDPVGPKQTWTANLQKNSVLNSHSPYYSRGMPNLTWGSSEGAGPNPSGETANVLVVPRMRNVQPSMPQAHGVQKLLKNNQIPYVGQMPNPFVPNCPEDLVKHLHDVEDDYDNDDGPVNYSLQYRDEHMTPGIQSPRTEEIYEMSCDENRAHAPKLLPPDVRQSYMHSQMSAPPSASINGPATKSDGGLSGLSSCIDSTGSSAPPARQDIIKSGKVPSPSTMDGNGKPLLPPTRPQAGGNFPTNRNRIDPAGYNLRYDDDIGYEDEKPTNFGAIYSEEQLYEPIQHQSMGMQPYSQMTQPIILNTNEISSQEPNPIREGEQNHPDHEPAIVNDKPTVDVDREEDDKFDMGVNAPPQYYYNHRSGRNSGIMTPRTPLEDGTPMMFSRSSSLGSVSEGESIHSSITSEPGSRMMSGRVSPSHLPDSPSQSMPVSPRRSPPPILTNTHPADTVSPFRRNQQKPEARLLPLGAPPLLPVGGSASISKRPVSERIESRMKELEHPGYVSSVPHRDEINVFHSEGTMSVMTKLSALTIDSSDKIQPIANGQEFSSNVQSPTDSKTSLNLDNKVGEKSSHEGEHLKDESKEADENLLQSGQRAVFNVGYITSLPTNDEIKSFMNEGALSPMTAFSEISFLQADNEGFQKSTGSVFSICNSTTSNKAGCSFDSRSSATGASMPPPAPDKWRPSSKVSPGGQNEVTEEDREEEVKSSKDPPSITSSTVQSVEEAINDDMDDDSDSLPSSSSDDDDLLKQCIERGLPKKPSKSSTRSTSSKYSNRSKSSRSKETASSSQAVTPPVIRQPTKEEDRSLTNPSPEVLEKEKKERKRLNIKQKIESANMKLKGVHIVDYIDNLIYKSDVGDENEEPPKSGIAKSKQVIDDAGTLQQSYSVRKKMRETEKQGRVTSQREEDVTQPPSVTIPKTTGLLPAEPIQPMQSKMRIQSYIREGLMTYATEGTPIEMSRCTSLSNLTIDSEGADNNDMTSSLQNSLKTSKSVPDIQSAAVATQSVPDIRPAAIPPRVYNPPPQSHVPSHVRSASIGRSDCSSPAIQDSREILEVLGKQIECLSLSTVESVITSEDPGYTRSLPHTDEIRKYNAEGSQFGGTEFSALTIDSDTKIAPTVPTEILIPETTKTQYYDDNNDTISPALPSSINHASSSTPQNGAASTLPQKISGCPPMDDVENAQKSSPTDVKTVKRDTPNSSWQPPTEPQPLSHYNNENDNLAMKEERQNYMIEDTPLNLSGPGSLSSLDFGSDDDNDLLTACITSALPPEKKNPYPPYPTQFVAAQQSPGMELHGRYNHGVPDGKVDSPIAQGMPAAFPGVQQQNSSTNLQMNAHGILSNLQSPNEEQWPLFQREAEELSAQLMQQHSQYQQVFGISDGFRMTQASDLPLSSSASLSQPTEGFYNLSRQASMQDSDLSIGSSVFGERHAHDAKQKSSFGSTPQGRKTNSRQQLDKHSSHAKTPVEREKKYSPGKTRDPNAARRPRNHQSHVRDSSSSSSTSYQQHSRPRHLSGNVRSGEVCSCQAACSRPSNQPRCFNHGPVSASTSHLVDGVRSPSRPRRKSTNSVSKNSFVGVDRNSHHHHHQPKPTRPRNPSRNFYRPSVTQLYPPLKNMVGVLEGVASVAARGDKVVADRNPSHYSSNVSKKSSSSSLVRSATFITENPSSVLLDSMTKEEKDQYVSRSNSSVSSLSPSQSHNSSRSVGKARAASPHSLKLNSRIPSPRGSTHSLKAQSTLPTTSKDATKPKSKKKNPTDGQTKPKHNKVWSGIKKLLSPSEESSAASKEGGKSSTPRKGSIKKETQLKSSKSPKSAKKAPKPTTSAKLNQKQTNSPNLKQSLTKKYDGSGASSLSLSSSSASNHSSEVDATNQLQNAVTPYGLLPKSPSVNAAMRRTVTNIPQSRSMGILSESKPQKQGPAVWRRTPNKLVNSDTSKLANRQNVVVEVHASNADPAKSNYEPSVTSPKTSEDVWISKKEAAALNQSSKIPLPQGQIQETAGEAPKAEASSSSTAGFQSPSRTQSPRVVQQVAPFNYKPSPRKQSEHQSTVNEKNVHQTRKIWPDCKQTPV